jgi:hypothetical protein
MPDLGGRLSQKQERFVEHYALCGNAAEAARLAGYSAKSARVIGPENLSKPAIQQALAARQRVFQQALEFSRRDVVSGVLSAIQMGREQSNPAVMIAGLVQVAKLCGFYEPEVRRVELDASGTNWQAKFAAMSDEELMDIINSSGRLT